MAATTTTAGVQLSTLPTATGRAGLRGVLASEFTKLRSVRSTYWTLAALFIVSVGVAAIAGIAITANIHTNPANKAGQDATQASLIAFFEFGQLVIAVLGALVITSEYSTGMIRTSLAVMPRRGVLYAAKAIVFAAVTLAISLVASFVDFFVGQAILASKHYNTTLGQPGVLRAALLSAAIVTVFGLLAYGSGAIIRHTAGAITAILGVIFLIPALAQALPNSWYHAVVRWLPGGEALTPIARSAPPLDHYLFSAWGEFAVFCGYTVVLLALGAWLFIRRDA